MSMLRGARYVSIHDKKNGDIELDLDRENDGSLWVTVAAKPNEDTGLASMTWAEFEECYIHLKKVKEALGWQTK